MPKPTMDNARTVAATVPGFAAKFPARSALEVDDQLMTWRELDEQSNRVANRLLALGYGRADRVAILAMNCIEYYVCLLGAIKVAVCAVPLPAMMPADSLSKMLSDSASKVLFVCEALRQKADAVLADEANCPVEHKVGLNFASGDWVGYEQWLAEASTDNPDYGVVPEDEFNIIYSSGTTGTPKGIVHTHAFRCGDAMSLATMGFSEKKITIITTALYSNWSVYAFLATLQSGGTSIVMPKFDVLAFLSLCETNRPDNVFLVPVQCERILDAPFFDDFALGDKTTKWVAGSPFDSKRKTQVLQRWPGRLVEMYGMTEGTPSTSLEANLHPEKLASVGQASDSCTIRILDDADKPLGPGETGEIVGHGSAMMKGYNRLPKETAALVWKDEEGRRFFRSGDLGYLDSDGFLYIVGRRKDMIVSGAFNVYPADLEAVLIRHGEVREVAVIGVPDRKWGETPLALVVPSIGATVRSDVLQDWVNEKLGNHQRLSKLIFVEDLPRGPTGKILKNELRSRYSKHGGAV